MSSLEFIQQVSSGDSVGAKENLSNMISKVAFDALDNKRQDVAKSVFGVAEEEVVEEETKQLDELEKKTLSNYITKAAGSYGYNMRTGDLKKAAKRLDASTLAQKKIVKKDIKEEVVNEESLTAGKKLLYKFGEGQHTAKIYHDKDVDEYQVHMYRDGKHMGEGPVSYHDDKEDAKNTAFSSIAHMNKKLVPNDNDKGYGSKASKTILDKVKAGMKVK